MSGGGTQKSLRKALGAIKDSTTVGLAKVNSDYKVLLAVHSFIDGYWNHFIHGLFKLGIGFSRNWTSPLLRPQIMLSAQQKKSTSEVCPSNRKWK